MEESLGLAWYIVCYQILCDRCPNFEQVCSVYVVDLNSLYYTGKESVLKCQFYLPDTHLLIKFEKSSESNAEPAEIIIRSRCGFVMMYGGLFILLTKQFAADREPYCATQYMTVFVCQI